MALRLSVVFRRLVRLAPSLSVVIRRLVRLAPSLSVVFRRLVRLAPSLSVVIRRLVCLGSFPPCWRQANVIAIPKDPQSSSVANNRQTSITSVLCKVFERRVSVRLGRFIERSGVFPTNQIAYRKGLGTCDARLCASDLLQSSLENGQEARIVRIDFSTPFNGLTIRAFPIVFALWVLEVLCCLY